MPILSNFPGGGGGSAKQASATEAGVAKLYTSTGSNTDGAMTQQAVTEAIPTTTSDLVNDSGFIEADSVIDAVDGEAGQVLVRTEDGAAFCALFSYGTEELVDGISSLATGTIYICYE